MRGDDLAPEVGAIVWDGVTATALRRLYYDASGTKTLITQATVSTITYAVYDDAGATIVSGSLTVSAVVYDSLQTGTIWTRDGTGFNFKHKLPATAFPNPNETYRLTYTFTMATTLDVHKFSFNVATKNSAKAS